MPPPFSQNINILNWGKKRVSNNKNLWRNKFRSSFDEKKLNQIIKNYIQLIFWRCKGEHLGSTLKINLKEYPIVNQLTILGEKSNKFKEQIENIISTRKKNLLLNLTI